MEQRKRLDKKSLLDQLENYKLIFQVNSELLDEDRLLKEQIHHKLGMIDSQLNAMKVWENANNQSEYNFSLDEANRILDALRELIEHMLQESNVPIDDNFAPE